MWEYSMKLCFIICKKIMKLSANKWFLLKVEKTDTTLHVHAKRKTYLKQENYSILNDE